MNSDASKRVLKRQSSDSKVNWRTLPIIRNDAIFTTWEYFRMCRLMWRQRPMPRRGESNFLIPGSSPFFSLKGTLITVGSCCTKRDEKRVKSTFTTTLPNSSFCKAMGKCELESFVAEVFSCHSTKFNVNPWVLQTQKLSVWNGLKCQIVKVIRIHISSFFILWKTHWDKNPQFIQKFTFWKSHF